MGKKPLRAERRYASDAQPTQSISLVDFIRLHPEKIIFTACIAMSILCLILGVAYGEALAYFSLLPSIIFLIAVPIFVLAVLSPFAVRLWDAFAWLVRYVISRKAGAKEAGGTAIRGLLMVSW